MEYIKKLDELITRGNGKVVDFFYEVFSLINSFDLKSQSSAFQYLCENIKATEKDEENPIVIKQHFTEEKLRKYLSKVDEHFEKELNELLFSSSKFNLAPDIFYNKVWNLIISNRICKNKYERALATFMVVNNDMIPYIPVGIGISMDRKQYSSIIDSFEPSIINETEMIMKIPFEQKTQRASLLINKLESMKTIEEKSVYLSLILNIYKDNIKNDFKSCIDEI